MKIKVVFHSEDDGFCQQLFKTINRKKGQRPYYARCCYLQWYTISDPFGFAELSYPVTDAVVFEVCEPNGTVLFKSSNGDEKSQFPFMKQFCKLEFEKFCKKTGQEDSSKHNTVPSSLRVEDGYYALCDWLLSFKDPDLYGEAAKTYDVNWTNGVEVKKEILERFRYCHLKCKITRIHKKHPICGVEWDDFYSGEYYCGSSFDDSNIGTMYSATEARSMVLKMLNVVYPNGFRLHLISHVNGRNLVRRMGYNAAALYLIDDDYSRKHIDSLIEREMKNHTFFNDMTEIEAIYGTQYEFDWGNFL